MNKYYHNFLNSLNNYTNYKNVIDLDENYTKIQQPVNILKNLKEHQKTCIYDMLKREYLCRINIMEENREIRLDTNIGILADQVGSGKTYIILGLIASSKRTKVSKTDIIFNRMMNYYCQYLPNELINIIINYHCINSSTCELMINSRNEKKKQLNSNLIVVPHNLFYQWMSDIKKFTNLSVYPIRCKKDEINVENFKNYDIILCNANKYNELANRCQDYKWFRVIFDEADSIKIPNNNRSYFNFIWFITTTFTRLYQHKNIGFIRDIFRIVESEARYRKHHPLKNALVVKSSKKYIDKSIILPEINRFYIKCNTPPVLSMIKHCLDNQTLDMLNSNNVKDGINRLRMLLSYLLSDTGDEIIDNIRENNNNIVQLVIGYLYQKIKKYENIIDELNVRIDELLLRSRLLKINVLRIIRNIKGMKDKKFREINEMKNNLDLLINNVRSSNICLICLQYVKNPSGILSCCQTIFCYDCIVNYYPPNTRKKCPFMCKFISPKHDIKLKFLSRTVGDPDIIDNYNKIEKVIALLKGHGVDKRPSRVLIFSNYDISLQKIQKHLDREKITYNRLFGHPNTIRKRLKDFSSGIVKVLLLNSKFYGSGLNLEMTTDIIIFHSLDDSTETQVIGRAQRMGRAIPLNVHYLYYDHEDTITMPSEAVKSIP